MFRRELEQFAQKIAQEHFQADPKSLTIETYENPGDITEGLSGFPLFFIKHRDKGVLFVIKAFLDENALMANTMTLGSFLVAALALKESKPTLPIGHVEHVKEGHRAVLIALEAAKGESLHNLLIKVGEAPLGSPLRQDRFNSLINAVSKSAKALAELNKAHSEKSHGLAPRFLERDKLWIDDFLAVIEQYPNLTPFKKQKAAKQIKFFNAEMQKKPMAIGYIHGDAHPGNLFYDSEQDLLFFTDLDRVCSSIGANGEPAGPVAFEYVFALLSLKFDASLHGLTTEEIQKIEESFHEAYKKKTEQSFPSEESIAYYSCIFWIRKLFLIATADPNVRPKMKEQIEIQRKMAIESLSNSF